MAPLPLIMSPLVGARFGKILRSNVYAFTISLRIRTRYFDIRPKPKQLNENSGQCRSLSRLIFSRNGMDSTIRRLTQGVRQSSFTRRVWRIVRSETREAVAR